jgi:hypothetical protein
MLSIYTTEEIIASIYSDDDERHTPWFDFIARLRPDLNVLLLPDSDYDDNDYNPLYMLQRDYDLNVKPEHPTKPIDEYISQIVNLKPVAINDPGAIYILDISPDEAERISNTYGIICHPFATPAKDCQLFQEGIELSVAAGEPNRSWQQLLDQAVAPSNSLVFIDRYLFSNDSRGGITTTDGIDNVYQLLSRILPQRLGVDYHVLLIFDATTLRAKNGESFQSVSTQLNRLKNKLARPYRIVIETISITRNNFNYDETHNRRVISNYFTIRVEHSLKAFRGNRSLYSQSLWFDWVASKGIVCQRRSDPPGIDHRKLIIEAQRAVEYLKKAPTTTAYAQNGDPNYPITRLIHRIIKQ